MSNNNSSTDHTKPSRRKFLVKGGLGALGLIAVGAYVSCNPIRRTVLNVSETLIPPYSGTGTKANLWLEMTKDNILILHSPKVEMGQGTFTGFAQIVADEFDIDIKDIRVKAAETSTGIVDRLSTGGSLSIASLFIPLREMAATMKQLVKNEAAKKLKIDPKEIKTIKGMCTAGQKSISYAEALDGIKNVKLPKTPKLKPLKDLKYIGKAVPRIDLHEKAIGAPIFGMDAELPDMLHATVIRPEHIGSKLKSADTSEAKNMPGVVQILERDGWIGIIADSFPEALAAKRKVKLTWDIPKKWSEQELRDFLKVGEGKMMVTQKKGKALDTDESAVFSMEFSSPIGAHAQIEPNGALADVKDDHATIILSTQVIGLTQKEVAKALGFKKDKVNVIGKFLGGGFGRRLVTSHAAEAALMSQAVGRPVKYTFTRKEEFQNDTFRPPTHHIMKAKLDDKGNFDGLEHHYASGDVAINSLLFPPISDKVFGSDLGAMRGGNIMYRNIPNHRSVQWHKTLPFATSFWRSLGLLANTFAIESFIDEIALRNNLDPIQLRLDSLGDDPLDLRIKAVIRKAVSLSAYSDKPNANRAMGFAVSVDVGSPCAQVIEVSTSDNQIRVEKVTCVFDCGLAVNPDQVKAQCEGSIIMGISASMHEKMGLQDGRLFPINYGSYDMALMKHSPKEINVHLIQGTDKPLPVGEPPLGPVGAAIANAIRRATGQRLTDLPLKLKG